MNRYEGVSKPSLLGSGALLSLGTAAQLLPGPAKGSDLAPGVWFQIGALALLAGGLLLVLAIVALYVRRAAQVGAFGFAAALVAGTGTILMCAIYWAESFMLPAIAQRAPAAFEGPAGLGSLGFGVVMAHVIFGVGWILVAVTLLRARVYGVPPVFVMMLGGALALMPFIGVGPLVLGIGLVWLAFSPAYGRPARYRRAEPAAVVDA